MEQNRLPLLWLTNEARSFTSISTTALPVRYSSSWPFITLIIRKTSFEENVTHLRWLRVTVQTTPIVEVAAMSKRLRPIHELEWRHGNNHFHEVKIQPDRYVVYIPTILCLQFHFNRAKLCYYLTPNVDQFQVGQAQLGQLNTFAADLDAACMD